MIAAHACTGASRLLLLADRAVSWWRALDPRDQTKALHVSFDFAELVAQGVNLRRLVRTLPLHLWQPLAAVWCLDVIVGPLALTFAEAAEVEIAVELGIDILYLWNNLSVVASNGALITSGTFDSLGPVLGFLCNLGAGFNAVDLLTFVNLLSPLVLPTLKLLSLRNAWAKEMKERRAAEEGEGGRGSASALAPSSDPSSSTAAAAEEGEAEVPAAAPQQQQMPPFFTRRSSKIAGAILSTCCAYLPP